MGDFPRESRGWQPLALWNEERPVAELVKVLWAYSIHRSCSDQEEGFWETLPFPFPGSCTQFALWSGGGAQMKAGIGHQYIKKLPPKTLRRTGALGQTDR